ncbi:MAG: hypothetical protein Q9M27_02815 [Mariprofundaceae bacterium]|nr:hypothetical protein [Mariprofundaceae bacterium]
MSKDSTPVKTGERVIFLVTIIFIAFCVVAFSIMEYVRRHSDKPMFAVTTDYKFSPEAKLGMDLFFRRGGCTDCHRALNSGTNMGPGVDLDGEGTKRGMTWIYAFLRMPEKTYNGPTLDHGPGKAASFVATWKAKDLHAVAVFLSALQAKSGSAVSPIPPTEISPFVDSMVKKFAPESWKNGRYKDMRKDPRVAGGDAPTPQEKKQ